MGAPESIISEVRCNGYAMRLHTGGLGVDGSNHGFGERAIATAAEAVGLNKAELLDLLPDTWIKKILNS
jgi:hypothetical protein